MVLNPKIPALVLAPMEGVTDARMRAWLTRTGFYDYCVTEFIRVSETALSEKHFKRTVPELSPQEKNQSMSYTSCGVPVLIQLLGGDPQKLAQTALHAYQAGAIGIDLNFGCPAPTVNRNDGGATLLKYPHRIEAIVRAVRDILPAHVTVSAKLRLGFDDPAAIDENSKRAEQGGAQWITIHGRTKTQGYTRPAYWKPIGKVSQSLSIPVIANGEIWTVDDLKQCQEETQCIHFMIGRGALSNPIAAAQMRTHLGQSPVTVENPIHVPEDLNPKEWANFFEHYGGEAARLKQWTRYLAHQKPVPWWNTIKLAGTAEEIIDLLRKL